MSRPPETEKKEKCLYLYFAQGITSQREIARRLGVSDTIVRKWIRDHKKIHPKASEYGSGYKDEVPVPEKSVEITNTTVYVENPPPIADTRHQTWEETTKAVATEIAEQTRYLRLNLFGRMQVCTDDRLFGILTSAWKNIFDIEYKINSLEYLDINRAAEVVIKHRVDIDNYEQR